MKKIPHGLVDISLYETGIVAKDLGAIGAIGAGDMTSEAAVVKLMYGLGNNFEVVRLGLLRRN